MAYAGKKVKVYIDTAGVGGAGATWVLIAQQDDLSIKYGTDKVDVRTKDDNGTPNDAITGHSWSGSFAGKLKIDDPAYIYLFEAWQDEEKVWLKFDKSLIGGTSLEGLGIVELEEKAAGNGVCEFTCTFTGQLELTPAVL